MMKRDNCQEQRDVITLWLKKKKQINNQTKTLGVTEHKYDIKYIIKISQELIKNAYYQMSEILILLVWSSAQLSAFHQTCLEVVMQNILTMNLGEEIALNYKLSRMQRVLLQDVGEIFFIFKQTWIFYGADWKLCMHITANIPMCSLFFRTAKKVGLSHRIGWIDFNF